MSKAAHLPNFRHRTIASPGLSLRRRGRSVTGATNRRKVDASFAKTHSVPVRVIGSEQESSPDFDTKTLMMTKVIVDQPEREDIDGASEGKILRSVRRVPTSVVWTRPRKSKVTNGEELEEKTEGMKTPSDSSRLRISGDDVNDILRVRGDVPTRYGRTEFPSTVHLTQPIPNSPQYMSEERRFMTNSMSSFTEDDMNVREKRTAGRLARVVTNRRRIDDVAEAREQRCAANEEGRIRNLSMQRMKYLESIANLELERSGIRLPAAQQSDDLVQE